MEGLITRVSLVVLQMFLLAACHQEVAQDIENGLAAARNGNVDQAIDLLEPHATAERPETSAQLAMLQIIRCDVIDCSFEQLRSQVLPTLANAETARNPHAQMLVARAWKRLDDQERAFIWYLKAAEQGHVTAMEQVIAGYRDGIGTKPNDWQLRDWQRKYERAQEKSLEDNVFAASHATLVALLLVILLPLSLWFVVRSLLNSRPARLATAIRVSIWPPALALAMAATTFPSLFSNVNGIPTYGLAQFLGGTLVVAAAAWVAIGVPLGLLAYHTKLGLVLGRVQKTPPPRD